MNINYLLVYQLIDKTKIRVTLGNVHLGNITRIKTYWRFDGLLFKTKKSVMAYLEKRYRS